MYGDLDVILSTQDPTGNVPSRRRDTRMCVAMGTIPIGTIVQIDTSVTTVNDRDVCVKKAVATAAGNRLITGVAVTATSAAGQAIEICFRGFCDVLVDGTAAVDEEFCMANDSTGAATKFASGTHTNRPSTFVITEARTGAGLTRAFIRGLA